MTYFFKKATGITLSSANDDGVTYSSDVKYISIGETAVATQAGITIPADRYVDKLIKKGALGDKFTPSKPANIKALKRVTNLAVAFATIPFSCWLLNKTYPLIMKKFSSNKEGKDV